MALVQDPGAGSTPTMFTGSRTTTQADATVSGTNPVVGPGYPGGVAPAPAASTSNVSAESTHQAIVAILIMGVFVYIMVIVAGISPGAGKTVSALFIGLILIQGAAHVNPFVEWVNKHPLTPTS